MVETIQKSPYKWSVRGNVAPNELSDVSTTSVYHPSHSTLAIETVVIIDGKLLTPVKMVPNW